jgi:hypothetical protein
VIGEFPELMQVAESTLVIVCYHRVIWNQ